MIWLLRNNDQEKRENNENAICTGVSKGLDPCSDWKLRSYLYDYSSYENKICLVS